MDKQLGLLFIVLVIYNMIYDKAAGDADKRIEEFYQTFLFGEESQDRSGSKKVQQTA